MGCCDQPGLMPLAEGLEKILSLVSPTTKTERVPLLEAANRILAETIHAPYAVPGFDNSAMDGYAIALENSEIGKAYPIQGKSFAGKPFNENLLPGHAIRIMTGAAIPHGCNCVIMQENTINTATSVTFNQLADIGNNIRKAGEDIQQGAIVLEPKVKLNSAHIALLASVGCDSVLVYQKTKVGLLSTGDELKSPGQPLEFGDIYNSNGPAILTMLNNLHVDVIDYGVLVDDPTIFRSAFEKADRECDFVITSGGVSVGEADYTKDVLEEIGEIDFWKLAIKPGKPFAFGKLPSSYFIGLPGNPVSAMVTFHILGSQAIRAHQQLGYRPMQQVRAKTVVDIEKSKGRMDFQRGHWQLLDSHISVTTTKTTQGSHILTSLANANCYIALEKDRENVLTGEQVTLWLFDEVI